MHIIFGNWKKDAQRSLANLVDLTTRSGKVKMPIFFLCAIATQKLCLTSGKIKKGRFHNITTKTKKLQESSFRGQKLLIDAFAEFFKTTIAP